MDLRYSDADEAFRAEIRAWLEREVPEHGAPPPPGDWPARRAYDTAWQRKLYDGGYAGLAWPAEFGGRGLPGQPAARVPRGVRPRRRAVHQRELRRPDARGPDAHRRGHRRAAGAPPSRDPQGRARVVPGLLRARGRLRPRVAAHAGRRATATSTSCRARRSGAPARTSPTTASCSCAPTPTRPSTRASRG